jgi:hypothetical protein
MQFGVFSANLSNGKNKFVKKRGDFWGGDKNYFLKKCLHYLPQRFLRKHFFS